MSCFCWAVRLFTNARSNWLGASRAKTGARLLTEGSNSRTERGRGRLPLERVPYANDAAVKMLAPFEHLILVNATAPIGFFAYPGKPGQFAKPGTEIARPDAPRAERSRSASGAR